MDGEQLAVLIERGLCLLRLSPDQWETLQERRQQGERFSIAFPHDVARNARSGRVVLVSVSGDEPHLCVGLIRSIQPATTFDSRVAVDLVRPVRPRRLKKLLASVTESSLRNGAGKLMAGDERFQAVSPKLAGRLLRLLAVNADNTAALQRILSYINRPKRFDNARALQQDALDLALRAFGVQGAVSVTLSESETALATVHLQENAVIEHDARWVPGWRLSESDLTGRALFTRRDAQLEVFTANTLPLEQLLGVDLIYLDLMRESLVMVQYKMMEPESRTGVQYSDSDDDDKEWLVPIDAHFRTELDRMRKFDQDLSPNGSYRLNSGAFFFKLVKRHAATNSAGIVLSLGHVSKLLADGNATGPRGGLRLSYKELAGHYLRSTGFVELIHSGYIGTRGATTRHLRTLIERTLARGRAVVAAMQSANQT